MILMEWGCTDRCGTAITARRASRNRRKVSLTAMLFSCFMEVS